MKTVFTAIITLLTITSAMAQTRRHNRFDTTYARKHELSVALGTNMTGQHFRFGDFDNGSGPSFSIQYARVYKFNHFLRTGLFVSTRQSFNRPYHSLSAQPNQGDNLPDNYTIQKIGTSSNTGNTFGSAFIGYEYGVGVRRFRFTFGADLLMGFHSRRIHFREDHYTETRTLDPASELYSYNTTFTSTGSITGRSNNIFMALSPRIGIRRELGRRIALALTFTPQVGYTHRLGYSEKVNDTRPTQYYNPKSTWFMSQNAELRLIIKLGQQQ